MCQALHTHTYTHAHIHIYILIAVVQSLSHAPVLATPQTGAHQAFLSFTISQSLLRLMSTESVMPSKPLILCHPLLLWPSIFPSIRVFSNKSALGIRWPKYYVTSHRHKLKIMAQCFWNSFEARCRGNSQRHHYSAAPSKKSFMTA